MYFRIMQLSVTWHTFQRSEVGEWRLRYQPNKMAAEFSEPYIPAVGNVSHCSWEWGRGRRHYYPHTDSRPCLTSEIRPVNTRYNICRVQSPSTHLSIKLCIKWFPWFCLLLPGATVQHPRYLLSLTFTFLPREVILLSPAHTCDISCFFYSGSICDTMSHSSGKQQNTTTLQPCSSPAGILSLTSNSLSSDVTSVRWCERTEPSHAEWSL